MEIQTFFLAEEITRLSAGRHDVRLAVASVMSYTPETRFPVCFTLPALIVLRRENICGPTAVHLRFDLVDEDGRSAGRPRRWPVQSAFADGNRFLYIMAKIAFDFPKPGRYRLDITSQDELDGPLYHYAIDLVPGEER